MGPNFLQEGCQVASDLQAQGLKIFYIPRVSLNLRYCQRRETKSSSCLVWRKFNETRGLRFAIDRSGVRYGIGKLVFPTNP
jgi:hypothetical protein